MEDKEEFVKNTTIIFLTILVLVLMITIIQSTVHIVKVDYSSLFPSKEIALLPEPLEKLQYILSLITMPALIISLLLIINRIKLEGKKVYTISYIISAIVIISVSIHAYTKNKSVYLDDFYIVLHPISGSLICLCIAFLIFEIRDKTNRWISTVVPFICVGVSFYFSYMNLFSIRSITNSPYYLDHFNAVYYAVSAVMFKHTLFVNLQNQYGLYPQLLMPLFKVTGLSVFKFTIVMAVLIFATFVSWYYFLYKTVKSKWVLLVGFLTTIYFCYIYLHVVSLDSYFQYFPLRTISPALVIFFAASYHKNKYVYFLGWFLISLGVLWNLDTGIVSFIAWTLTLLYKEVTDVKKAFPKKIIYHLYSGLATSLSVFILYSIYIKIRSGYFPNYGDMFNYIKTFYNYGLAMMPMPIIHTWYIVIFIYIVGLVLSIRKAVSQEYDYRSQMIFTLSILGLGLFSYYQGRSHEYVLTLVWYPAFLLLTLYVDGLLYSKNKLKQLSSVVLIAFMAGTVLTAVNYSSKYHESYIKRIEEISSKDLTSSMKIVEFIKKHSKKGENIYILSYNAGVYYGETETTPTLDLPGTSEMIFLKDYNDLQELIKTRSLETIFVDNNYSTRFISTNEQTLKFLKDNYVVIDKSHDSEMSLYQRK